MASYDYGALIRCKGVFTDEDGVVQDPAVVKFQVRDPDEAITIFTYGVGGEVVKVTTGIYYLDVDANLAGIWYYRVFSTGAGQAAAESQYEIEASQFD